MKLSEKQQRFAKMVALLIQYIDLMGYAVTFGDAHAYPEDKRHCPTSFHYQRLAVDLNLFKDGKYLSQTEDHAQFGAFWKLIGGSWGGDFLDGNHYSYGE